MKRSVALLAIVVSILTLTVGYALFSESINIEGTATAQGTFDVGFSSATVANKAGSSGESATINVSDNNLLKIEVPQLEFPGAYVEFAITVINNGSIPAKLISVDESDVPTDPNIKIEYPDLKEKIDQQINQNDTQTFHLKIMWDENSTQTSKDVSFTLTLNYQQVRIMMS